MTREFASLPPSLRLLPIAVLLTLASCVGPKKLRTEDAQHLTGATIATALKSPPSFFVFPGAGGYHLEDIAGPGAQREMNRIDPAALCAKAILKDLAQHTGAKALLGEPHMVSSCGSDVICSVAPQADFVLALRTAAWSAAAGIFKSQQYGVFCVIEMRLVDRRTGKTVASGHYPGIGTQALASPVAPRSSLNGQYNEYVPEEYLTLPEITTPSSPALKRILDNQAHRAAELFIREYLAIPKR